MGTTQAHRPASSTQLPDEPPDRPGSQQHRAARGHEADAGPGNVFTSGLAVPDYLLLAEAGFQPLGFVTGSAVYHVRLPAARRFQSQELQVMSKAMYNVRRAAMSRMRAKADHLGADGIVGVQLRSQIHPWGQEMLESAATGTAVNATGGNAYRAPDGSAFTSDLPAQDFLRLLSAGAVPVASVLGTCVYHIAPQAEVQALRQAGPNQEMIPITQCVHDARERALSRMRADPAGMKASGIVGVNVAVCSHAWGEHATEFLATGTAIRRLGEEHQGPATSPQSASLHRQVRGPCPWRCARTSADPGSGRLEAGGPRWSPGAAGMVALLDRAEYLKSSPRKR